jgi:hypothetical protein
MGFHSFPSSPLFFKSLSEKQSTDPQDGTSQAARTATSHGKEREVIDLTSEGVVTDEDNQTADKVRQTPSHISYPLLYPLIFPFLVLCILPSIIPFISVK